MMSGNHPKLILDGIKTQTRRTYGLEEVNKNPDDWLLLLGSSVSSLGRFTFNNVKDNSYVTQKCPYGGLGDRLVIKETWATENQYNHLKPSEAPQTGKIWYLIDEHYDPQIIGKVRSSMFMCNWMSRAKPEITDIRVERVQEITNEDAIAEGICVMDNTPDGIYSPPNYPDIHRDIFIGLWDSLSAKRGYSWTSNPFIWVISFCIVGEYVDRR